MLATEKLLPVTSNNSAFRRKNQDILNSNLNCKKHTKEAKPGIYVIAGILARKSKDLDVEKENESFILD